MSDRPAAGVPRRPRILLVDGDAEARATAAAALGSGGFAVEQAPGLEAALPQAGGADAVLLARDVPDASLPDALRLIAARHPRLVLGVLGAVADEVDEVVALELGADFCLRMGASMRVAAAQLRAALRRRDAGVAPEARGRVAPEARGGVAPEARGNVAPEARGNVAPEARGNVAPEARGDVTPEARGDVMPEARQGLAPEARQGRAPAGFAEAQDGFDAGAGPAPAAGVTIDPKRRVAVLADGTEVPLNRAQRETLQLLISAAGGSVSRERISVEVLGRPWSYADRTVDNLVLSLRRRLGLDAEDGPIRAVRNIGYRLVPPRPGG